MVPSTLHGLPIGLCEKCAYFFGFEIARAGRRMLLRGKRQYTVVLFRAGWVIAKQMPEEGTYCGESAVARAAPILAVLFQMVQVFWFSLKWTTTG